EQATHQSVVGQLCGGVEGRFEDTVAGGLPEHEFRVVHGGSRHDVVDERAFLALFQVGDQTCPGADELGGFPSASGELHRHGEVVGDHVEYPLRVRGVHD